MENYFNEKNRLSCTWFVLLLAFVSNFMPIILFNTTSNSKDDAILNKAKKNRREKKEDGKKSTQTKLDHVAQQYFRLFQRLSSCMWNSLLSIYNMQNVNIRYFFFYSFPFVHHSTFVESDHKYWINANTRFLQIQSMESLQEHVSFVEHCLSFAVS